MPCQLVYIADCRTPPSDRAGLHASRGLRGQEPGDGFRRSWQRPQLTRASPARHAGALFGAFPYIVAVECLATAFPLIGMVGSGIMAQRVGLAPLANAIATGGALVALIVAFRPRSGAL